MGILGALLGKGKPPRKRNKLGQWAKGAAAAPPTPQTVRLDRPDPACAGSGCCRSHEQATPITAVEEVFRQRTNNHDRVRPDTIEEVVASADTATFLRTRFPGATSASFIPDDERWDNRGWQLRAVVGEDLQGLYDPDEDSWPASEVKEILYDVPYASPSFVLSETDPSPLLRFRDNNKPDPAPANNTAMRSVREPAEGSLRNTFSAPHIRGQVTDEHSGRTFRAT